MVGDYNQLGLEPLMADLCDSNGCGGGDSQSFNFNWTGPLSIAQFATGSLSMTGNIDDSPVIEQALLQALNTTLLATSECTQQATVFPQPGRRSIVPMPKTISSLMYGIIKFTYARSGLTSRQTPVSDYELSSGHAVYHHRGEFLGNCGSCDDSSMC